MVDILAFGAHPDDVEFFCGGILCKMARLGKEIVIADATLGEMGTHGTPHVRREEGIRAAKVIGARRIFLDFQDCRVFDSFEGRMKLAKVIREVKPRLVLAPLWRGEMNHPDHLALGVMARHACRYARFATLWSDKQIHRVEGILHYLSQSESKPDFLVDISDDVETWKKMMECHESQVKTFNIPEWCLRTASYFGTMINVSYAGGLVAGNPVVVEDLLHVAKGTREL